MGKEIVKKVLCAKKKQPCSALVQAAWLWWVWRLSDVRKVAQQRLRRAVGRDGAAGQADLGDVGAVRGAAALKLSGKEAVQENLELFQNVAGGKLPGTQRGRA